MKNLVYTAGMAFLVSVLSANEVVPVEEMSSDAAIVQEKDTDTVLQEYLDSRPNGGWKEGVNHNKNGIFVVEKGIGAIQGKPDSVSYNDSRSRAFDKAMMDAKAKLAEFLENEISMAASYSYVEPPIGGSTAERELAETIANQPSDSIIGKAKMLVSKKLDNLLRKEGYDVDAAKAGGKAREAELKAKIAAVQGKETFQKVIKSCSSTVLSGAQAFYTVEIIKGGRAEIGVILVWSPKLAEMASSLVNGRSVSRTTPKKPIKEQINKDPDTLLTAFGVQQKIDENGEYVLVAFGQAAARSSNSASANMARTKARQNAQAMIRSFAGETIAHNMAQEQAEETLDFGEGTVPDYRDQSSAERIIKAASAKMSINGLGSVYSWNARHPISGRLVYGTVVSWNPSQADIAREVKKQIESSAKDGAAGRRTVPSMTVSPVNKPTPTATERVKVVNQGDADAF